jgi:hypothetical protein
MTREPQPKKTAEEGKDLVSQVWKIPINPQRPPDFLYDPNDPGAYEPNKAERARAFCFKHNWCGIGWGLPNFDRCLTDPNDYLSEIDQTREELLRYRPSAAKSACNAFAYKMQEDDFVWCRTRGDVYWLGRIVGKWMYKPNDEFHDLNLYQVRECHWKNIGTADLVPGPIKNAYAGRGQAIARIVREGVAALHATEKIWDPSVSHHAEEYAQQFSLGAIAHDDLEDIVALYLQKELGWFVVPSTVKKSTPSTEFVLRNANGGRAYLQVKVDDVNDQVGELPEGVQKFFIFDTRSDEDTGSDSVVRIPSKKIKEFIEENLSLMPSFVRSLAR